MKTSTQTPQPNKSTKPFILKERHEDILKAAHLYRYITIMDITRLFFAKSSISHVREYLSRLCGGQDYKDREYLFRFPMPHTRTGNSEKIYTLGSKGRSHLQELGIETDWYFRPSDSSALTYQHLQHALTLTHVLVAAQVFVQTHQGVELPTVRTEYDLKKEITKDTTKKAAARVVLTNPSINTKTEETLTVIPDAWLKFHFPKTPDPLRPVLLEIDRGTEQQQYFKRHIRSRVSFIRKNGPYFSLFDTNYVTVAYATTGNEARLKAMLRWTEETLTDLHKQNFAGLFRFRRLSAGEFDDTDLFQNPTWFVPFTNQPLPLLY